MQLDHINISAPMDLLREVRDFYCAVLGLRDGPRPDFSRPDYWLYADDLPLVHLSESKVHYRSGTKKGRIYFRHSLKRSLCRGFVV